MRATERYERAWKDVYKRQILYSIAISCRLNGINLFEYICDVIEKTEEWQPNTPWEKYRDLLPDRWKKQQQH